MKINSDLQFGKRLASLRKAKGFTQYTLADALGISNRMVAYYEKQTDYPPTHLLPKIANVLKASADELLGLKSVKDLPKDGKLWRQYKKIETLPKKEQKKILEFIEFISGKYEGNNK